MAFTRFKYDECRTKKYLQQATGPGRWVLNVPGNGEHPHFPADPFIRIQGWGGNLRTNPVDLESELRGVNRTLSRDEHSYEKYQVSSKPINYNVSNDLTTEQSRTTNPAWWYRDLEQGHWQYPQLNPQEKTCIPFQQNLNTRILEKDYFNK
jgi:hypothetical protein